MESVIKPNVLLKNSIYDVTTERNSAVKYDMEDFKLILLCVNIII